MFKRLIGAIAALTMLVGVSACGGQRNSEPEYADEEAMSVIAEGLQKRFDVLDQQEKNKEEDSAKNLKKAVQAEIDNDKSLKSSQFKNSKMQEDVISYLNLVDDSMDVLDKYGYNTTRYDEQWNKVYDKRTAQLKKLVDKYGLNVDSAHQDDFKELVANGTSVQKENDVKDSIEGLLNNVTFDKSDEGPGYYEYSAVIENTTKYSFKNVSLILALYDSNGVKAEEAYASTNSWVPGEKVKFEADSDVDAAQVKPSFQYYDVDE